MAHGDPLPRRVARTVVRAFSSTKQPRELAEILTAVQAPVTTGRRIVVTSVRGGAGKTAVAALVGSVFAARRADPVLAVDAEPEFGSLPWRLGVESAMTLPGVAPALMTASGQNLTSLEQLLPRTTGGLWVVPGGTGQRPQLVRDLTRSLSRLFAVSVLDCTTGMAAPANNAVLADAHAVIVVVPATPDGVRTTADALARLAPGALQHVVIALNALHPHGRDALRNAAARAAFERLGLPVVSVPHDRHVASGAPINPGRIGEPTLTEASRLAAWALHRARQW
ncbi:chromosome partitioning protein [Saccharopolyspora gregorii]|uniref:MinD/ParA family protein n=1 Tax=Saccharopolyspora gregorii TaxID=33914 RepID=A0ABP6RQU5_9PSEU